MNEPFDSDAIAKLGWRQGAVLDAELAKKARAPWLREKFQELGILQFEDMVVDDEAELG